MRAGDDEAYGFQAEEEQESRWQKLFGTKSQKRQLYKDELDENLGLGNYILQKSHFLEADTEERISWLTSRDGDSSILAPQSTDGLLVSRKTPNRLPTASSDSGDEISGWIEQMRRESNEIATRALEKLRNAPTGAWDDVKRQATGGTSLKKETLEMQSEVELTESMEETGGTETAEEARSILQSWLSFNEMVQDIR